MSKILVIFLLSISLVYCNYSQEIAQKLCKLSVSSYCNIQKLASWTCKPCLTSPIKMENIQIFYNSTGDSAGFIGTSKDLNSIFLVFRGTLPWDIKNWIEDINFLATNFSLCDNKCKVHRGFYDAYKQIGTKVLSTTKSYMEKYNMSNIMITGHSLGGALATHAVADLHAHGIKTTYFYSFGSPRVGDSKFSTWFQKIDPNNQARVTHSRDPVPHLPPESFGFLHVRHEIFYKSSVKDGYKVCSDTSTKEDPKCSNQYLADVSIPDHLSYYGIDFGGIILSCQ